MRCLAPRAVHPSKIAVRDWLEKRDTREKRDPKFEVQGSKFQKPRTSDLELSSVSSISPVPLFPRHRVHRWRVFSGSCYGVQPAVLFPLIDPQSPWEFTKVPSRRWFSLLNCRLSS